MYPKNLMAQIEGLYGVYEEFLKLFQLACKPKCAVCCTCNVSLTTLEGFLILENLAPEDKGRALGQIQDRSTRGRYRPQLTTNEIAARCARGQDIPDEPIDSARGPCPLICDGLCQIYSLRPFGCRCMVSHTRCSAGGQAEMNAVILSANTLMLQIIEHIDAGGYSGNFADVILCIYNGNIQQASDLTPAIASAYHLIANRPIPVLMIPPEHRTRLQPLLQKAQKLLQPRG